MKKYKKVVPICNGGIFMTGFYEKYKIVGPIWNWSDLYKWVLWKNITKWVPFAMGGIFISGSYEKYKKEGPI
jgi:hypothetical protein